MADTPSLASPEAPDLLTLRQQIDAIDRELLALLNKRSGLSLAVGALKKREGSAVFRPEREAQVIDGLKAVNGGPLQTDSIAPIWREIMSASRALETPTRVAYLGPAGTFSELAALAYFGASIVRVPCASIDEVFRSAAGGAADFGVVPVENSTEGVVARSLDLFLTTPLGIIGETSLFVRHNLLRKGESLEGIGAVCAHPQAWRNVIAGCRITCPMSSAGPSPAMPKARVSPRSMRRSRASPANARPASTACMWSRRRSRTIRTTAPVLPSSRIPTVIRNPKLRATIAPAWSSPWRTSPAPCTTCWCR